MRIKDPIKNAMMDTNIKANKTKLNLIILPTPRNAMHVRIINPISAII